MSNLSAATKNATRAMARLREAVRPPTAVRAANDSLARLLTAAGVAPAAATKRSSHIAAFGSSTDRRTDVAFRPGRHEPHHMTRTMDRATRGIAVLPLRLFPAAPERPQASAISHSLEASIEHFAEVFLPTTQLLSPRSGRVPPNPRRPTDALTMAPGWLPRLLLPAVRPNRVSVATRVPLQRPADTSISGGHALTYPLAGLRIRLEPLLALMRNSAQGTPSAGRVLSSAVTTALRRLSTMPRSASSGYFRATPIKGPADAGLSAGPLTACTQRLSTLAHIASLASTAPRSVAGLIQGSRYLPPARRHAQLAATQAQMVSGSRHPLLDRRERPAPIAALPAAASSPPSTINVTINVHGVVHGDDFVRRHGHAIAEVLDQVMERRARRAF
jgi:hypothetical protein